LRALNLKYKDAAIGTERYKLYNKEQNDLYQEADVKFRSVYNAASQDNKKSLLRFISAIENQEDITFRQVSSDFGHNYWKDLSAVKNADASAALEKQRSKETIVKPTTVDDAIWQNINDSLGQFNSELYTLESKKDRVIQGYSLNSGMQSEFQVLENGIKQLKEGKIGSLEKLKNDYNKMSDPQKKQVRDSLTAILTPPRGYTNRDLQKAAEIFQAIIK
jgi:hypothetical protein